MSDRFVGAFMARRDMRPGTVFGVRDSRPPYNPYWIQWQSAFVVIDDKTEIDFWTGTLAAFGDIAPQCHYEVLA